jgi:hypothetical protein
MEIKKRTWTTFSACAAIEGFDDRQHDYESIIGAYQHLIDTGIVWQLQGSYGRHAANLIESGVCHAPT